MGKISKCNNEIVNSYYKTNLTISIKGCSKCPIRLYNNKDDKITFGIGNIVTNTIIVLLYYNIDDDTETLTVIRDLYKAITGEELLENVYVTRLVKCYCNKIRDLYNTALKKCYVHAVYEINRIQPNKIIVCGSIAYNIINKYINNTNIKIINIISPYAIKYSNYMENKFVEQFTKALMT